VPGHHDRGARLEGHRDDATLGPVAQLLGEGRDQQFLRAVARALQARVADLFRVIV
jgi:hypothetical protein